MKRIAALVAVAMIAASCTTSGDVMTTTAAVYTTTTVTPNADYMHNGVNVVDVARGAMRYGGDTDALSDEEIYRNVLAWTRLASVGASEQLTSDVTIDDSCLDTMIGFVDDVLDGRPDQNGIGVAIMVVGEGLAAGAAETVDAGSMEWYWLDDCLRVYERMLDPDNTSEGSVRCERLGDQMEAAESPEERAAYENLYIDCLLKD